MRSTSVKRATFFLILVLIAVTGIETVVRLFLPSHDFTRLFRPSPDGNLEYEFIPSEAIDYEGGVLRIPKSRIEVNRMGFRDREQTLPKPRGLIRILAVGDSYTFGLGVDLEKTWPKVLEALLREHGTGTSVDVLNLGIPGYNATQTVAWAKTRLDLNPDLVIFLFSYNDLGPTLFFPPSWIVHSIGRLQFFSHAWGVVQLHRTEPNGILRTWSPEERQPVSESAIADLDATLRERGIPLVIGYLGSVRSPTFAWLNGVTSTLHIPLIGFSAKIGTRNRGKLDHHLSDGHLNDLGNKVLAEELFRSKALTESIPFLRLKSHENERR